MKKNSKIKITLPLINRFYKKYNDSYLKDEYFNQYDSFVNNIEEQISYMIENDSECQKLEGFILDISCEKVNTNENTKLTITINDEQLAVGT